MSERSLPQGYPVQWKADVVLRHGPVALLRPIVPDDAEGMRRFQAQQSERSTYLRFFGPMPAPPESFLRQATLADYRNTLGLVVTVRDAPIGYAHLTRLDPRTADVAFNVADSYHDSGVGSLLLEHLAAIALGLGVQHFVAEVLRDNRRMLARGGGRFPGAFRAWVRHRHPRPGDQPDRHVVPSGDFAESGPQGLALQQQLRAAALRSGMRVVGPFSFGVINADPARPLNVSLAYTMPPQGRLGLFAESGSLAVGVLASARRRNLGLSVFASAGNRADVSSNDLMQDWIDDAATEAVGLYLAVNCWRSGTDVLGATVVVRPGEHRIDPPRRTLN